MIATRELTFNPERHVYTLDGKPIPSTTTILKVIDNPRANEWRGRVGNAAADRQMKDAAAFGTRIHQLCESVARGTFDPFDCTSEEAPFVESFQKWLDTRVEAIFWVEERVASEIDWYAGTIDLVVHMKDRDAPTIVDLKTGRKPSRTWGLQLAAYGWALREWHDFTSPYRLALWMPSDRAGYLEEIHYPEDDCADLGAFLAALTLHNWMNS